MPFTVTTSPLTPINYNAVVIAVRGKLIRQREPVLSGCRDRVEDLVNSNSLDKVLVRNILEHAHGYSWTMQELGLLGLRLDDRREYRLHVWDPGHRIGGPVIHDHPYDFVSTIVAGELTNVRYEEDPTGVKYLRDRYSPPNEDLRSSDFIQLAPRAETHREGDEYAQLAHELHDSHQLPGTVTIIRMTFRDVNELTVCRAEDAPWISGVSRPATSEEVEAITSRALTWF
jgi:hypothetical protein